MKEIRYYESFTDDFTQSANQAFTLPPDYQWIPDGVGARVKSGVIYTLALIFGGLYCRIWLGLRIKNKKVLRGRGGSFFLFGNHTQPVGDVFLPALCAFPRRIYTLAAPANYGIPVIGKLLPHLGALPVVDSVDGMKKLTRAMEIRLSGGHPIVIYPEAHVWEYCSFIRPFPPTAMKYPVKFGAPAFSMTVTYQKTRFRKRPQAVIYLDGPFYGKGDTPRERALDLHAKLTAVMNDRAKESNSDYIVYQPQTMSPGD